MGRNDVLIGWDEIAQFLGVSSPVANRWRKKYATMPLYQDGLRGRVCADREKLGSWQKRLFAGELE